MNWNFLIYALAIWRLARMVVKEEGPASIFSGLREFVDERANQTVAVPHKHWPWIGRGINCLTCTSVWAAMLLWFTPWPVKVVLAGAAVAKLIDDYFYVEPDDEDLVEIAPGEFMERSQVPRAFYEHQDGE